MSIQKTIKDDLTNQFIKQSDAMTITRSTLRSKPTYASQTNEMYIDESSVTYHTHRDNVAELFEEVREYDSIYKIEVVYMDGKPTGVRFGKVGSWEGPYSVNEGQAKILENIIN